MRMIVLDSSSRLEFIRRIQEILLDGKRKFIAEFKLYRVQRSIRQNRLYYLWLNCIKDETGNDVEYLHSYFKNKFLTHIQREIFGEEYDIVPSTRGLDTKEFTDYLEKIRIKMLEQCIYLPEPGEQGWDDFYLRYGIK